MAGYVPPEMVRTPWGDASTLRERRLAPGRGTPRDEARRNQRDRLFAAMVAVCAGTSFTEVSVADLVLVSGVSSRSFYEQFSSKEDCLLATMNEILANVQELATAAFENDGGSLGHAHQVVEGFVAMVAAQPAAAKLCIVSAFSAGEAPRERIVEAVADLSALVQRGLEEVPGRDAMPLQLTEAVLGGVALVLYRRLAQGRIDELDELGRRLGDWVLAIPPPPRPLRPRQRRRASAAAAGPPPLAAHVPGERILRAFASVVADKGFGATTIADVAARAHISQNTFYKHFRGKEDALEAALDSSGAQMLAATLPAVRRAREWPAAVRVALEALCGFMAAEPEFARLREVEVYAIGPEAVAQRDRARAEIVLMLNKVAEPGAEFDPLAVEATLGAFQYFLYGCLREGVPGAGRLRELAAVPAAATYLALAPQLGPEEAWEVACG